MAFPQLRWRFSLKVLLLAVGLLSIWLALNRHRFSPLAMSERRVLDAYSQANPPKPTGPNYRQTRRYVVTLRPGVSVMQLFVSLNGHHHTQQWCLMPSSRDATSIGIDTTDDVHPHGFRKTADRLKFIERIETRSTNYLDDILGECEWRNVSNQGAFDLVVARITEGTSRSVVHRLLGESAETADDGAREVFEFASFHWHMSVVVDYDGDQVKTCSHRVKVQGPPTLPSPRCTGSA